MRVLIDTNVLISSLISPPASSPYRVVLEGLAGTFELMVSASTLGELAEKCQNKPYLVQRVSEAELLALISTVEFSATILSSLTSPAAQYTRDPKDDYLIAHALAEEVDVLVSGDRDLLALDGIVAFRILSPADFAATLGADATE